MENYSGEEYSNVVQIVPFGTEASFNEDEAERLVKALYAITTKSSQEINTYKSKGDFYRGSKIKDAEFQQGLNELTQKWAEKVVRLGCDPVDLYVVRIPADGKNYFWKFPNTTLQEVILS